MQTIESIQTIALNILRGPLPVLLFGLAVAVAYWRITNISHGVK